MTGIILGAGVQVVTRPLIWHMQTALILLAGIRGAHVFVIATLRWSRNARFGNARIPHRTVVSIIARSFHWGMGAARIGGTSIDGTRISVTAIDFLAVRTGPVGARAVAGTEIPVIAENSLVVGHKGTCACPRMTKGLEAKRVCRGGRVRTGDDRFGINHTFEWHAAGVAHEGAVALDAVLQHTAITVDQALTVRCRAEALSTAAFVCQGTRVGVVAWHCVRGVLALPVRRTFVVRARVVIITIYWDTKAGSRNA